MSRNSDGTTSRFSWLLIYLKGVCMGAADAVPGVSGGTIALITGIYERLISAVTAITPGRIKRALGVVVPGRRADAIAAMREVDVGFLLALGAGIATAIVTVMRVLHIALNDAPVPTYGFFFGLIAASAVVLYAQVSLDGPRQIAAAVTGFVIAFVASGGSGGAFGHSLPAIAVAGGIAVSAMILPGVSGSLLLLILGQYEYMNAALNTFIDRLIDIAGGASLSVIVEPGTVVITFMLGAVVGLFSIAHVVRWALEHHRRATLAFLVSLIVGALRAPVVESTNALVDAGRSWSTELYAAFAVAAVVGAAVVLLVDRYTGIIES
ncbi:DUF368 domain-containing protein [Haloferax sp. Atlit-10N]|uniref:DUF368 domain-containing protein n=1 Tax=Haloferax prahovense (strain DSM 18310 / JCM 13924 / TL6) TaxID=1227461 RepID=M0GJX7_HALPT|nr:MULTISPECIES: DUF368 domain-containing protein [Haloferax]ELZ71159.1 hypothetical protein C457_07902 [Haloferax prahovense DSM 18310]RDZ45498.1 DUF368 domain-containing protein [Haloferax sp. Atlit-19N]RDZ47228.1 DUF368 domain-containing protein [Haloferax sp. Atlit-16N]RDZ61062.1 DUF368 domain-containing protein [Haloferax sp. Atlit-10N]